MPFKHPVETGLKKELRNHNRKLFLCLPQRIGRNSTNVRFKLLFLKINLHFVTSNQISSYGKLNLPLLYSRNARKTLTDRKLHETWNKTFSRNSSPLWIVWRHVFKIKFILIHEYQHKSTRVNTNLHESTQVRHESTRVWHKSTRINRSLTRVNTNQHESNTSQHESKPINKSIKRVSKSPTQVNTNQHKSKSV